MFLSENTQRYIIEFLINNQDFHDYDKIIYSSDISENNRIVIIPSTFFSNVNEISDNSSSSMLLDYDYFPGIDLSNKIEFTDRNSVVINSDIIAWTFILLSRYEEIASRDKRDKHGRFLAEYSILSKFNCLEYPVVDLWGHELRKAIRKIGIDVSEPSKSFHTVSLTHDVDRPWECFSLFSALRRTGGNILRKSRKPWWPILNYFGNPQKDPINNFAEIIQIDKSAVSKGLNTKSIFFVVSGRNRAMISTFDYLHTKAFSKIVELFHANNAMIGWHISYEAADSIELMNEEINELRANISDVGAICRNHFLRSKEPEDFDKLISLGIKDDYTMGFADHVGFRLGTSRVANWINPITGEVTELRMHPLQIMECSLYASQYMNCSKAEASDICARIIERTRANNGDLALLWHNTALSDDDGTYSKELYLSLIRQIAKDT